MKNTPSFLRRMKSVIGAITFFGFTVFAAATFAAESLENLRRGSAPLDQEDKPAPMYQVENKDIKRPRAYSMQPPTIPHKTDNYQVDLNANKCLSCHSRVRTAESQAPMVSVTHYQDRDNNFLAEISPRRFFCHHLWWKTPLKMSMKSSNVMPPPKRRNNELWCLPSQSQRVE